MAIKRGNFFYFGLIITLFCSFLLLSSGQSASKEAKSDVYLLKGMDAFDKGLYKSAIISLNKAIELNDKNGKAYTLRGISYTFLNEYQSATKDLTKAIEIDPKNVKAYSHRGLAKYFLKDFEGSIIDFSRAIKLNPKNDMAYFFRAQSCYLLGDIKGSLQDFDKAIKLNPEKAEKYNKMKETTISFFQKNKKMTRNQVFAAAKTKSRTLPEIIMLREALENGELKERESALSELYDKPDNRLFDSILKALKDEESAVRLRAISVITKMRDKRVLSASVQKRVLEPLYAILKNDKNTTCRENAAIVLGYIKDKRNVVPLISALKDPSGGVRYHAASSLGNLKDQRAVEPLIPLLNDELKYARMWTADALGRIGDKRAVDPLLFKLKDESWEVRKEAVLALGRINDKRVVEPLISFLNEDPGRNIILEVIYAFARINDRRVVEPLIKLLKHKNPDIRWASQCNLEDMTGMKLGSKEKKWKKWWRKNKDTCQLRFKVYEDKKLYRVLVPSKR